MARNRERLKGFLEKRFSLRLHMFLILSGVFCAGLLCSKLLLELQVRSMLIRYPLAVLCSYLVFFGMVRFWLFYLSSSTGRRNSFLESAAGNGSSTFPDLFIDVSGSAFREPFSNAGGSSGGGGASASFDSAPGEAAPFFPAPQGSNSGLASGFDGTGKTVSAFMDGDDSWVLIVLGLVLAIICGAGIYLIYQAPVILSDAAFQAILSTSLIKRMNKMSEPDWIGSVIRATAIPFLVVLSSALAAAWAAHRVYPEAVNMSEVLRHLTSAHSYL
jgi:hypothetical protein